MPWREHWAVTMWRADCLLDEVVLMRSGEGGGDDVGERGGGEEEEGET